MARLCDTCASITYKDLLKPNGVRCHSLSKVIEHATVENFPCPLCTLIWWSLRSDHAWLEEQDQSDVPVLLWRGRKTGSLINVVSGPVLREEDSIAEMQYDFLTYIARLERDRSYLALGTLCLYRIHGQPTPNVFGPALIEPDSSSERSLRMVQSQVRECIDDHPQCSHQMDFGHPKRVIDVRPDNDANILRIREVSELGFDKERLGFVALSYCWGDEPRFVTTSTNILANKTRFYMSDLPRTIQDAITITRKFEIRYLWVDALCILQGQDEEARNDWAAESKRMSTIYGSAILTISAASAKTAFEGILGPRSFPSAPSSVTLWESLEKSPGDQRLVLAPEYTLSLERMEPLSQRAWALQEKMLSKRTLIYGTSEIIFVCRRGEWRESGHRERYFQDVRNWQSAVEDYTTRTMTKPSDRLPAIQGLADYFHRKKGEEIVKGVRMLHIEEDLLWQHVSKPDKPGLRLIEPLADQPPSWSWVVVEGAIQFHKLEPKAERLFKMQCNWITVEDGPVKLKRAVLRGDGRFLHVDSIKWQAKATYDALAHNCCPLSFLGSSMRTFLDCPSFLKHDVTNSENHGWKELRDVWFLRVSGTAGLILREVHEAPRQRAWYTVRLRRRVARIGAFERIGMYTSRPEDLRGERLTLENVTIY